MLIPLHASWMFLLPAVFFVYYIVVWLALGRNPAPASVVTRYTPPDDLSPAGVRYVTTGGCDSRTLAAVIAQLAARDCLAIEPLGGSTYKLTQVNAPGATVQSLKSEELRLLQMLFEVGPAFTIDASKATTLNMFASVITEKTQKRLGSAYFSSHLGFVALGIFLSFICAGSLVISGRPRELFGTLFLTVWFFFCGSILGMVIAMTFVPMVVRALRGLGGFRQLAITFAVLCGFGVGFVFVMRQLSREISLEFVATLFLLIAVHPSCAPFLRRVTPRGRAALDQIEGFRQFLLKAEEDRLQRLNRSEATNASQIQFLPYAIALDIREAWGDHFATSVFGVPASR